MRKFFGIKEAQRTAIPEAKRAVGVEGDEEFFAEYFNQAIYETQVDYIIGTTTQVTNGTANVKIGAGAAFQDALGATVVFSQGDRIAIAGHDALDANVVFPANDLVFIMNPDVTIDLASTYTFTASGTGARGNLNFSNAFASSIIVSDSSSLLDIKTDFDGSVSAVGDVIVNGNLYDDRAGENLLIGNLEVWQRGTSFLGATSGYHADRFYDTITNSVDITRQSSGAPIGSQYYWRAEYQGAGAKAIITQPFGSEEVEKIKGRVVTASVRVRCGGSFAADLVLKLRKNATADTMTGGAWSDIATTTIANADIPTGTTASDWVFVQVTATVPDDGTANGFSWDVVPLSTGGLGEFFEVSKPRVKIGSVANDLDYQDAGEGLSTCLRYYEELNVSDGILGSGFFQTGGTNIHVAVPFKVKKRVSPTITEAVSQYTITGYNFEAIQTIAPTFANQGLFGMRVSGGAFSTGAGVQGEGVLLRITGTGGIYISSELT